MLGQFQLKPSPTFVLLLFGMHSLALVSVWLTHLETWLHLTLSLLILLSFYRALSRYALLRDESSWRSFSLNQHHLVINTRSGEELGGEVMHRTVVTSHCIVLCVSVDGHKIPFGQVIFFDAMQAEAFRELRVSLKYA